MHRYGDKTPTENAPENERINEMLVTDSGEINSIITALKAKEFNASGFRLKIYDEWISPDIMAARTTEGLAPAKSVNSSITPRESMLKSFLFFKSTDKTE